MKTVKFLILLPSETDGEQNTTIIAQDGGVASLHHNQEHMLAELYQSRITPDTKIVDMWETLSEGKMYYKDYEGFEELKPHMIIESCNWLFCSTKTHLPEYLCYTEEEIEKFGDYDEVIKLWLKQNYKE